MQQKIITSQRLIALFVFGVLAFNYPILSLFNRPESPGGFPLLFVYVFGAWLMIIVLAASIIERRKSVSSAFRRSDS